MTPETFDEDYYAILGVRRTATAAQIKHAFRSKAKLLHPDRNRAANATDQFIRLGEAYRVLRDDEQRLVFDAFLATVAPPPMRRRPVWRAAAVMAALFVSLGAASTFGYFALTGGPATLVAESAPAKPVPVKSAPHRLVAEAGHAGPAPTLSAGEIVGHTSPAPLLPLAGEGGLRVSGGRMRDDPAEGALAVAALVPASLIRPLLTQGPPSPASGRRIALPEAGEALVASLSDSVDAPFAIPQASVAAKDVPSGDAHASETSGTQLATAAAAPSQRVDPRLAQQVGVAPKAAAAPAAAAPVTLHKPAGRPVVRVAVKPPYPVRAARPYPYRVAAYPPYPRASVRRPPVRRYQAPQWSAPRPAVVDDWPF